MGVCAFGGTRSAFTLLRGRFYRWASVMGCFGLLQISRISRLHVPLFACIQARLGPLAVVLNPGGIRCINFLDGAGMNRGQFVGMKLANGQLNRFVQRAAGFEQHAKLLRVLHRAIPCVKAFNFRDLCASRQAPLHQRPRHVLRLLLAVHGGHNGQKGGVRLGWGVRYGCNFRLCHGGSLSGCKHGCCDVCGRPPITGNVGRRWHGYLLALRMLLLK